MRSELENLENIDKYLGGEMTPSESAAFEAQMEADPALKSLVEDQQLFIQTVSRKALMAEINMVAGATAVGAAGAGAASGFFGNTFWVVTSIVAIGGGAAGIAYVATSNDDESDDVVAENVVEVEEPTIADDPETIAYEEALGEEDSDIIVVEDEGEDVVVEGNEESNSSENNRRNDLVAGPTESHSEGILQNPNRNQNTASGNDNGSNSVRGGTTRNQDGPVIEDPLENDGVELQANQKATFKGGISEIRKFLEKEVTYPASAKNENIEATLRVKFHVTIEGSVAYDEESRPEAECYQLRSRESGMLLSGKRKIRRYFEEAAESALRKMKFKWNPQTSMHGAPEYSQLMIYYFKFDLDTGISFYPASDDDAGYE